mmetsp:Transcript_1725/g.1831  ORF Transcript_1725/g.1831 Transcript_1725/m.1831 type:complete len:373 (-) Transcript_1725:133-1251(-)
MRPRDKAIYRLSVVVSFIFINGIIFSVLSASKNCEFSLIDTKPAISIDTMVIYMFISLAAISLFGLQTEITLERTRTMVPPIKTKRYVLIGILLLLCTAAAVLMFACWAYGLYNIISRHIKFDVCPLAEYTFLADVIILTPLLIATTRYCCKLIKCASQIPAITRLNVYHQRVIYRDQFGHGHTVRIRGRNEPEDIDTPEESLRINFNELLRWIQFLHDSSNYNQETQPLGLTTEQVQSLRRTITQDPTSGSALLCSICLDEIAIGSSVIKLRCEHLFHEECLAGWLERNAICPNCKNDVEIDDEEEQQQRPHADSRLSPEDFDEDDDMHRPLIADGAGESSVRASSSLGDHYSDSIAAGSYLNLPNREVSS